MSDVKSKEEIRNQWEELKQCFESMEKDLTKNLEKGNSAAGRRVRSDLREVKKKATELVRELVKFDKSQKG